MEEKWNESTVTEILLLGFQDLQSYRIIVFFVLHLVYLASVSGNLLIILLVTNTQHLLHSPMYYFLSQLSITDLMLTTSVSSTLLPVVWNSNIYVPIAGCFTQLFMIFISTSMESLLLTTMSYDRYLAICKPLHYVTIMSFQCCLQLTLFIWVFSFIFILIIVLMVVNLQFCGPHIINHFFCELFPLVQLSCSDKTLIRTMVFLLGAPASSTESLLIITTYSCIFYTILRIPSSTGRQKAFSTCISHLTVVCTYYGTLIAVYLAPTEVNLSNLNKCISLMYTVTTPLLNPLIYSLKNKEIHTALQRLYHKSASKMAS